MIHVRKRNILNMIVNQNDQSLPPRPMSKKSSLYMLIAQYHLFQHSAQDLLGLGSMIFLCNKVFKGSKTAQTEHLSNWFAFSKWSKWWNMFLKSGWVKRFHQTCKDMMLNKPKIFHLCNHLAALAPETHNVYIPASPFSVPSTALEAKQQEMLIPLCKW